MKCSACRKGYLRPARIDEGLPGYTCTGCRGMLLSLSPYVDWMAPRRKQPRAEPQESFDQVVADTRHALSCPKCSRIMVKYKVLADAAHGLDYCFGCEEVWLDPGEWDWLKAHGVHLEITSVTTEAWQRRLRQQQQREAQSQRFRQMLGDEIHAEANRIREWLAQQPARAEILHYLGQE